MNEFYFNLIVQLLGLLGIIANVMTFQSSEHKKLIVLKTANELLFGVQYLLLGAYTGMAMNFVGCVRNVIFGKMVEKEKSTVPARWAFSILFVIFAVITRSGFKSVLIGGAKVLSTVAYGSKNVFFVRILVFITSICWFCYNFQVGSVAGCVCEGLALVSIIVGIIRIDIPALKESRA